MISEFKHKWLYELKNMTVNLYNLAYINFKDNELLL